MSLRRKDILFKDSGSSKWWLPRAGRTRCSRPRWQPRRWRPSPGDNDGDDDDDDHDDGGGVLHLQQNLKANKAKHCNVESRQIETARASIIQ